MSDTETLLVAIHQFAQELDASIRECTALVCSVVISAEFKGLDTPEKVVAACELIRKEIIEQLRKETPK